MFSSLLGSKIQTSSQGDNKRDEQSLSGQKEYGGKHIDIIAGGNVPGEAIWTEQKPMNPAANIDQIRDFG